MKLGKAFQALVDSAKDSDDYWIEKAKLDFSVALEKQRVGAKMTYASVAKALGTSAAYITKVFRGDSNVTIESMVKLARATGGRVEITVVSQNAEPICWRFDAPKASPKTTHVGATVITFPVAANNGKFDYPELLLAA
ncbi:helix-turn-helix protein [compost metagenome]